MIKKDSPLAKIIKWIIFIIIASAAPSILLFLVVLLFYKLFFFIGFFWSFVLIIFLGGFFFKLVKFLLFILSSLIVTLCPNQSAGSIIFTIFTLINDSIHIYRAWNNSPDHYIGPILATCAILYFSVFMIFGAFTIEEY